MGPWPSSLVLANDQVILAQWGEVLMAKLERPLGVENVLIELNPEGHTTKACQEVPVRILIATHRYQKFTKGSPLGTL